MASEEPADSAGGDGSERAGFLLALGAYLFWGTVVPLYFKAVAEVAAEEVLAHRVVWSAITAVVVLAALGQARRITAAFQDRRAFAYLLASALLISTNWLVFIYAIAANQLLQASLGYYMTPLVSVVFGVVLLRERLSRLQLAAVLIAVLGVANMVIAAGVFPWVSLVLACSFGLYGGLRKQAPVDGLTGFCVETILVLPPAVAYLGWLVWSDAGTIVHGGLGMSGLLALSGAVTALPLVLFAEGAKRLRLSTVGFMFYLTPTCQFFLAVFAFDEVFGPARLVTFALIWTAVALYSVDIWRGRRRAAG